ncbi:hypothetical protein R0J87_22935, partial [Halomonas sp. SIMBA_159]
AVLIGSTTGSIIGTYSLTRQQVNSDVNCENHTIASPQERLQFLQKQVHLFQDHLQELAQDLSQNEHQSATSLSPKLSDQREE